MSRRTNAVCWSPCSFLITHGQPRLSCGMRPDALFLHLAHEKVVEYGTDGGDGTQLADLITTRRDSRRENVRAELKLKRKRQIAHEYLPHLDVVSRLAQSKRARKLVSGDDDAHGDHESSGHLHPELQPLHRVNDDTFDRFHTVCYPFSLTIFIRYGLGP